MMLVAGAGDLISIFLGIEILSVALYVLCALEVWRERSLESGLKYLITGAVGASVLLYGLALLFGATGTTAPERDRRRSWRAPRSRTSRSSSRRWR